MPHRCTACLSSHRVAPASVQPLSSLRFPLAGGALHWCRCNSGVGFVQRRHTGVGVPAWASWLQCCWLDPEAPSVPLPLSLPLPFVSPGFPRVRSRRKSFRIGRASPVLTPAAALASSRVGRTGWSLWCCAVLCAALTHPRTPRHPSRGVRVYLVRRWLPSCAHQPVRPCCPALCRRDMPQVSLPSHLALL